MKKQMVCPICQAVNDVEDAAVGCYVLCRNCPHRFYVPVPPLGEGLADEPPPPPNVVPDYKAWDQRWTSRAQGIETLAAEMRWQRMILLALFVGQVVIGLMVLSLLLGIDR